MQRFLSRFASSIGGVLSGFDRLVLSGQFLPLMYPRGMMGFLSRHQVLLKDFMGWAKERTEQVVVNSTAQRSITRYVIIALRRSRRGRALSG